MAMRPFLICSYINYFDPFLSCPNGVILVAKWTDLYVSFPSAISHHYLPKTSLKICHHFSWFFFQIFTLKFTKIPKLLPKIHFNFKQIYTIPKLHFPILILIFNSLQNLIWIHTIPNFNLNSPFLASEKITNKVCISFTIRLLWF